MSEFAVPIVTTPRVASGPSGIGGWLLIFLISFSAITPVSLLLDSYRLYQASGQYHRMSVVTAYELASWSELLLGIAFVAAGMLIVARKPQARRVVPVVLWVSALWGVTLWSFHWMLPLDAPLRLVWAQTALYPMFQRIGYAIIWTSYWLHSQRVANTFADPITGN